jgi:hypothetical protein
MGGRAVGVDDDVLVGVLEGSVGGAEEPCWEGLLGDVD